MTLEEFNLSGALHVCLSLPANERALYERIHGHSYNACDMAAWAHGVAGMKWLVEAHEVPVAIGGFVPVTPGTFRTWFYATQHGWAEHGFELTELVGGVIREALKLAHRVETVTLADQEKARAWYPRIGLHYESTLRGYGANGEAAVMYVALRDAEAK